ncbi:phenylalanine--tRNA ligase subunit beta [Herbiconiux moechotypicola]|uniref:Phenylalanine--tRNA ligase beta subunit n=1 Tax=Herbiconiux moechotypicola TaxID=637393 RepID=A0ABP5QEE2_9MICO|nr:phenylalanine--tRNA ligase subunit beta [Herbiconiux moechotypicola]MCS5729909.1 phenylalanine--tRNA ligase subunit beta [Herbiconiux moechotypicola]
MRVPISWLAEYVDVPADASIDDIHAALVKVGLEEEGSHGFDLQGPIVVGQVLSFEPEPQSNGKTIRWCQVRVAPEGQTAADGGADVRGIVCGASNFVEGDKVVVTLPGAVLPGGFAIAARKTYGHVSDGMIASARELGLGDDHDGILRLATLGLDPEVGTDALALLSLDDSAVEVNVTPDRGYAFSIRGIAREYSHSTGAAFRDPVDRVATVAGNGFPVSIHDEAPIRGRVGATVFVTRVVRGIDPTVKSPAWLVSRLKLAGIRSISLVVDITNYVMLEFGQPIHGYDLDALQGGIVVRRASEGETLETLDGAVRTLHPEDLVIADDRGAIGLAGVMGGASTEIGEGTTDVLIEAANFDPVSIARTARRHKLPSEASRRFERGVDPKAAQPAAARVVELLETLAGGTADGLGSVHHEHAEPGAIMLPFGFVQRLVGVDFTPDDIARSLAEIGSTVEENAAGFEVTPPSWRPDLIDKASLAEEVARIVGYDRIPSILPVAPPGRGLTVSQQARRRTADVLAAGGLTEVLAYPFLTARQNAVFGSPVEEEVPAIVVANPLDSEAALLRTSLLPGLIDIARRNLSRGLTDLAVFEIGSVFVPEAGQRYGQDVLPLGAVLPDAAQLSELHAGIPPQPRHIGALLLGNTVDRQPGQPAVAAGIADALDTVRLLESALAVSVRVAAGTHKALHPGRTAELFVQTATGEAAVGFAGEILPALADELDLPRVVAVLELDLDALIDAAGSSVEAAPISGFPAATQDLSLVVDAAVPAGEVESAVVAGAGELLESIRLVDDYRGAGLPDSSKSLTFALRFRAPDRTLTAAEASEAKLAGAARAAELHGATVRE